MPEVVEGLFARKAQVKDVENVAFGDSPNSYVIAYKDFNNRAQISELIPCIASSVADTIATQHGIASQKSCIPSSMTTPKSRVRAVFAFGLVGVTLSSP